MSAGLKGDLGGIRRLERTLRELPRVLAIKVAAQTANTITELSRETFDASQNAFGDKWATSTVDGHEVTLRKSGGIASSVKYVAIGTKLRAQLGPRYARYQVGKRPVFPRAGGALPPAWVEVLRAKANQVIREEMGGA